VPLRRSLPLTYAHGSIWSSDWQAHNALLLPAGEYIAVEKIEAVYKKNPLVEQIWVYGNSFESVLVAVRTSQPYCRVAHPKAHQCTLPTQRLVQVITKRDMSAGHRCDSLGWGSARVPARAALLP